jgi:hypothetical protein
MKKILIHILTAALASMAAVFVSCSGGGGGHAHDVYVAGTFGLLKNGVSQSGYGSARSVFVTDNGDIFVAGSSNGQAILWQNGASQTLYYGSYGTPNGGSVACSVCVSWYDVIVVGYAYYGGQCYGMIWDGNTGGLISRWYNQNGYNLALLSVYYRGDDHYAAGYTWNNNGYYNRLLVKNSFQSQTLNTNSDGYIAESVYVSKTNNVYVAGSNRNGGKGVIWKDGIIQTESLGSAYTSLSSIFVSDNGVYVAGDEDYNNVWNAMVWKDGKLLYRLQPGSQQHALAQSVFVSGKDVYAAGYEYDDNSSNRTALLWTNGKRQVLGAGTAYSVFVR